MKQSDFNHIVKESIREAFYTLKKESYEPENAKDLDQPLINSNVPGPQYGGWWMRPNLTFFTALRDGLTDHELSALIELGRPFPSPSYPYQELFKRGYVRIKSDGDIIYFNPSAKMTNSQIRRLYDICIETNKSLIFDDGRNEKIIYKRKDKLNEELFGIKLKMEIGGKLYPALISKNTREGEEEYKLTWFHPIGMIPADHLSFGELSLEYILQNKKLPVSVAGTSYREKTGEYSDDSILHAKLIFDTKDKLNEELFLLEEGGREIDLWLENKILINESMDLYVQGANYDKLETMGEISWRVMKPVWEFLEKLPEDQKAYFQKNRTQDILTPDGPYYDEPTGILNLYTAGLTRQALIGVMKIIFAGLKELGFTWGKVKTEQSGAYKKSQVIRIPILKNPHVGTYKGPPELNMSNVNAYQIFHNVLQYEGEHEFSMEAKELMERIETLAHDKGWIDKNAIKPTDSDWPESERDDEEDVENPHLDVIKQFGNQMGSGVRMIGGGLSGGDIRRRLGLIWSIAKWAVDHGFEKLYVA